MRLLFIHQHYYPETVGTSTRLVEIAEYLAARGHQVTVVTGIPSHPSTMASGEVLRHQPRSETTNGVLLHRTWVYGSQSPDSFLRRMLAYGSFMIMGCLKALCVPGPFDAVVAVSPLPNGIAGVVVSKLRGIPLMFDVCDIWPDCAIAVGMLRNRLLIRVAFWLEALANNSARRIGVVTPGFTENLVAKGVPRDRVRLLPDWVDPSVYDSSPAAREAARSEYGFADHFVVSFLGNFGLLMGLESILETARVLKDKSPDVLFLFVGKGVGLSMMQQRVTEWNLANVMILPYQPRSKVPAMLAASDALIVTYIKTPITRITVPSKIYEYMSSARPIVAGVEGVIADILMEAECGLVSECRDPEELAAAILRLKEQPELCAAMGRNGRQYARQHFTFDLVAANYEKALLETMSK